MPKSVPFCDVNDTFHSVNSLCISMTVRAYVVHYITLRLRFVKVHTLPSLNHYCFGPGTGYIWTGIAEIYSSSITGSDINYKMLATMVLITFLLKCCVITQQEAIMQDVYTFMRTDQCQLPEYDP